MGRLATVYLTTISLLAVVALIAGLTTLGALDDRWATSAEGWAPSEDTVTGLEAHAATVADGVGAVEAHLVQASVDAAGGLADVSHLAQGAVRSTTEAVSAPGGPIAADASPGEADGTAANVTVAIVGQGIDDQHPVLEDRVVEEVAISADGVGEATSPPSGHTTRVATVVAAAGTHAERGGVAGPSANVEILSVDISSDFTTANAVRAFDWLEEHGDERGVDVVLSSWGRPETPARYVPDDPVVRASDSLVEQGIVVVFSAGNEGPASSTITVEAANPNVIGVGAANSDGEVEAYSSRGPVLVDGEEAGWTKPDLVAPGMHVGSRAPVDEGSTGHALERGTSLAAPHVATAAAVVLAQQPGLTPQQVEDALRASAQDIGPPGVDEGSGAGLLAPTAGKTTAPPGAPGSAGTPSDAVEASLGERFVDQIEGGASLFPFAPAAWTVAP